MDNPVFKLEGVVHERSAEALQDFEGPLDLILFLLSKNKIEIQDIPIALILDQYLAYLEQRKQLDLEVASEFITMAAHLMYIKTRMLLSLEDEQAQSEMDELIASLKERQQKDTYLRIKTLTETLGPMGEFGRSIMTRQPEPMQRGKIYEYSHEKADLVLAMQTIMERGEKLAAPPSAALSEIVRREPYPVKGKAEEILHRLKEFGMTRFKLLFRGSRSRSEIVATFIAVLELCREKVIHLAGSDTDCTVESLESLDLREVESAIEGILFASGEPLPIDRICLALDLDRPTAEQVLQKLGDYYAFERRGIRLVRMEDSYQLCSSPDYADVIRKAFEIRKTAKLSQPALEVLTIIAYYQPTTRAYIDQVRGVDSSYTVGLLLERGLIEECGRLQVPGRPRLYRTTKKFLRDFHLCALEEMPEMPCLEADGQLRMTEDGTILDPSAMTEKEGSIPENREH